MNSTHTSSKPAELRTRPVPRQSEETPVYRHFVARTKGGIPIFRNQIVAEKTWSSLQQISGGLTLACLLMPDHIHWLLKLPPSIIPSVQHALTIRIALAARSARLDSGIWQPVEAPKEVADSRHLQRTVRYILLNPNRRKLIQDPLDWRWSTLLDSIGAVPRPWVSANILAKELGWQRTEFESELLHYIYEDDDVSVSTPTWMPPLEPAPAIPLHPLPSVRDAFARAHRISPQRLEKKSRIRTRFLFTATSMQWNATASISGLTGMNPRNSRRLRQKWRVRKSDPMHIAELRATRVLVDHPTWGSRS